MIVRPFRFGIALSPRRFRWELRGINDLPPRFPLHDFEVSLALQMAGLPQLFKFLSPFLKNAFVCDPTCQIDCDTYSAEVELANNQHQPADRNETRNFKSRSCQSTEIKLSRGLIAEQRS